MLRLIMFSLIVVNYYTVNYYTDQCDIPGHSARMGPCTLHINLPIIPRDIECVCASTCTSIHKCSQTLVDHMQEIL